MNIKNSIQSMRSSLLNEVSSSVCESLSNDLQYAMDLAQEKGASNWLTTLPIREHGFTLHKGDFRDALALRYGWTRCPSHCPCGTSFSVEHALSYPKGGFPTIRHNEVHDLSAGLMSQVCHDVGIEPVLQPLNGEEFVGASTICENDARLDIVARGFWLARGEHSFFDNYKNFQPTCSH